MSITYFFVMTAFEPRKGLSFTKPRPQMGSNANWTMAHYCTHLCQLDDRFTITTIDAQPRSSLVKFRFSKKATKFETISHLIWRLLSKCQIKWEIISNFCGLFRMSELYADLYIALWNLKLQHKMWLRFFFTLLSFSNQNKQKKHCKIKRIVDI